MAKLKIGGKEYIGDAKTIARLSGKSVSEVNKALGGTSSNNTTSGTNNNGQSSSNSSSSSQTVSKPTATPSVTAGANALGGTTSNSGTKNNQYVGVGTYNDGGLSDWAKKEIETYKTQYNDAIASGNMEAAEAAHKAAEEVRARYGYSGGDDGSEYIKINDGKPTFGYSASQPSYSGSYDSQMDELLKQILNRDDFSYDVANDPLYQQYANMYHREGDRAMKEAMAEAAAGAGGMNTYAMTAAQQANNYYNSQLNDKIPELYQLAYDMYLADKESKVQDLGILQSMDANQYNRYRDTMADWKDDRNFAYDMYRDAVSDSQWQTSFDNNNYWANKEFDYNDMWKNKEWYANREDVEYERNQAEKEKAKAEIEWYIENGVTTISPDLIERSGLDQTAINQMIAAAQAEQAVKKNDNIEPQVYDLSDYRIKGNSERGTVVVDGYDRHVTVDELDRLTAAGKIEQVVDHTNKTVTYRYVG